MQREDWPIRMEVIGAHNATEETHVMREFMQALQASDYTREDAKTLISAIAAHTVRAMLCIFDDGTRLWIIEKMIGEFPPQNWSLEVWRTMLHTPPCPACGHKPQATIATCKCDCHEE